MPRLIMFSSTLKMNISVESSFDGVACTTGVLRVHFLSPLERRLQGNLVPPQRSFLRERLSKDVEEVREGGVGERAERGAQRRGKARGGTAGGTIVTMRRTLGKWGRWTMAAHSRSTGLKEKSGDLRSDDRLQ
jgi:hypothetical protein